MRHLPAYSFIIGFVIGMIVGGFYVAHKLEKTFEREVLRIRMEHWDSLLPKKPRPKIDAKLKESMVSIDTPQMIPISPIRSPMGGH